jgi:hypothetical protein
VWLELLLNSQLVGGTYLSGPYLQSGEVIYFTLEIVVLAQVRSGGGSRLIQEPSKRGPGSLDLAFWKT